MNNSWCRIWVFHAGSHEHALKIERWGVAMTENLGWIIKRSGVGDGGEKWRHVFSVPTRVNCGEKSDKSTNGQFWNQCREAANLTDGRPYSCKLILSASLSETPSGNVAGGCSRVDVLYVHPQFTSGSGDASDECTRRKLQISGCDIFHSDVFPFLSRIASHACLIK